VSLRTAFNVGKYLLAGGLLAYVIWSNWGYSQRVAGTIVVGPATSHDEELGQPTISGRVVGYVPGQSIAVAGKTPGNDSGEQMLEFLLVRKKTTIEPPADADSIQINDTVSVWEHPGRGLAYVWREHVVEGKPIHWGYLGLAAIILTLSVLLTFLRWYYLVRAQDLPFRIPDALRLGIIGFFFNTFMPGSVGGDAIKAVFLAREQKNRRTIAVATVIMDRAIALWALVWFVAICGLIFWAAGLLEGLDERGMKRSLLIIKVAAGIVVTSFSAWLLLGLLPPHRAEKFAVRLNRLHKVGHSAAEMWRAVWMYRCRQGSVAMTMLISWIGHIGFVLTFYFSVLVLRDAHDPMQRIPTLAQHFLIVPIGLVINAMPLFPGGAGIGELGFGGLYKWLGASVACGVLGSLVQRVIQWVLSGIGYLFYLRLRRTLQAGTALPAENGAPRDGAPANGDAVGAWSGDRAPTAAAPPGR
jgi:uncharacterized protein (TIRG00374 family)